MQADFRNHPAWSFCHGLRLTGGRAHNTTPPRSRLLAAALLTALTCTLNPARAGDDYSVLQGLHLPPPQRNLFGEVGLIDTPTARMAPDGALAFTIADIKENQRYALSFQALPWLAMAFRFSAIDSNYYDRSFSFKARLMDEGGTRPALAFGMRDLLGTGVYGGEYFVLSKKIGHLDFSGGLGWGRFADRDSLWNPMRLISSDFKKRDGLSSGTTGQVTFSRFMHGPVGLFGGISWITPLPGLRLNAEYSGDQYKFEQNHDPKNQIQARSPVSVGFSYAMGDHFTLSASWVYGDSFGLNFTFHGDPGEDLPDALRIGPPAPHPAIRSDAAQRAALGEILKQADPQGGSRTLQAVEIADAGQAELAGRHNGQPALGEQNTPEEDALQQAELTGQTAGKVWSGSAGPSPITPDNITITLDGTALQKLKAQFKAQKIGFYALSLGPSEAWLWYENGYYRDEAEALGRIARLLSAALPPDVEYFHLIAVSHGRPVREVTLLRSALERMYGLPVSRTEVASGVTLSAPAYHAPALAAALDTTLPALSLSLAPKLAQHVFDPDDPLQFMIYARGGAVLDLAPGWTVNLVGTVNMWDDYNYDRSAGSDLPHVRSDIMKYAHDGKYGISAFDLEYRTRLGANLYALARVGYLEDMYAGFGGQILWRPEGSRLAYGIDLYQVWKRDFDRLMGFKNYNVATGHASLYLSLPSHYQLAVHAGRYLARDWGATFELSRRFDSGVEIGAFASFTTVPFDKFGEGSFDKGLILRIPMQWALPVFSQSSYSLYMSSLTRDGGQRLAGDDALFEETRRTSYEEIARHYDEIP